MRKRGFSGARFKKNENLTETDQRPKGVRGFKLVQVGSKFDYKKIRSITYLQLCREKENELWKLLSCVGFRAPS